MYITVVGGRAFSVKGDEMIILEDGVWEATPKRMDNRTIQQNRALHLYCKQIADELNKKNIGVTAVLKPEVSFSMITVKEQLYKPILAALRGKNSTRQMNSKEMNEVYDVMNKVLGERFGIHIPFPSVDEMLIERQIKEMK